MFVRVQRFLHSVLLKSTLLYSTPLHTAVQVWRHGSGIVCTEPRRLAEQQHGAAAPDMLAGGRAAGHPDKAISKCVLPCSVMVLVPNLILNTLRSL